MKKDVVDGNDAKETVVTTALKEDIAGPAVVGGSPASQDSSCEQAFGETDIVADVSRVRGIAAASSDVGEKNDATVVPGNTRSIDNLGSNSDSCKMNKGNTVKRIRML